MGCDYFFTVLFFIDNSVFATYYVCMREINIISESTSKRDIRLIFGDNHDVVAGEFLPLSMFKDMADIWAFLELFPSRSQAIKNNHGQSIPNGFTDIVKRKRGLRVTIWNCEEFS